MWNLWGDNIMGIISQTLVLKSKAVKQYYGNLEKAGFPEEYSHCWTLVRHRIVWGGEGISTLPSFSLWLPVSHLCFITQHLDPCCFFLNNLPYFPSTLSCCPTTKPVSLRCHIFYAIFPLITFKGFPLLHSLFLAILQILSLILLPSIIFCSSPSPFLQLASSLLSFYKHATFIPASNSIPEVSLFFCPNAIYPSRIVSSVKTSLITSAHNAFLYLSKFLLNHG